MPTDNSKVDTPVAETPVTHQPTGREEAVLRFYSSLGEELRRPLASLAGWVELMAVSDDKDTRAQAAAAARPLLRRLRRLADDAHDSADATLGELELHRQSVDLATVVEALTAGHPNVSARIDGPAVVEADGSRIFLTVEALLAAGIGAGGSVEVAVRHRGAYVEIAVAADRSLPFSTLQGLFEPFNRSEDLGEGLSLFLCRAIAVAHGGTVGADADGTGTTLWLRLPAG